MLYLTICRLIKKYRSSINLSSVVTTKVVTPLTPFYSQFTIVICKKQQPNRAPPGIKWQIARAWYPFYTRTRFLKHDFQLCEILRPIFLRCVAVNRAFVVFDFKYIYPGFMDHEANPLHCALSGSRRHLKIHQYFYCFPAL